MKNEDTIRESRGLEADTERSLPEELDDLPEGQTDWAYLEAMTGEEAHRNAVADPDNPPLTADQLARLRPVPSPKKIRLALGLTQEEFSRQFEIALGKLRDWEQGISRPDSTAKTYLRVIEKMPGAVRQSLHPDTPDRIPTVMESTEIGKKRAG